MSKFKYTIAKDKAGIIDMIASSAKHYKTARNVTQNAAINILIHAAKHGDYTLAAPLVDAVKSGDAKPLVKWFVEFGGLTVDEENGGFSGWSGAEHIKENLERAKGTMFWDYKEASPYKGFDLHAQLGKQIDAAEKALEKLAKMEAQGEDVTAMREMVKVDPAELTALKAVYNSTQTVIQ